MNIKLEGIFKKIIFNGNNGYTVGLFKVLNGDNSYLNKTITITGYFPLLNVDETYIFTGSFVKHNKYGEQFNVISYERVLPKEKDSIVEFLSGGLFKGVGEKTASKIVERLGENTLNIILDNPSSLLLIPGIKEKTINLLHDTLEKYEASYKIIIYLSKLGFSYKDSISIYNKYKDNTIDTVLDNIYKIYFDILDISFTKVDNIALKNGITYLDSKRVEASIIYAFNEVCNIKGDTYLYIDELYDYTRRLLKTNNYIENFNECINNLIDNNLIYLEDNRYYLYSMYESENTITNRIGYLIRKEDNLYKNLDKVIYDFEKDNDLVYDESQKEAIKRSFINNFLIISGGPGTGKTTIINAIVNIYKKLNKYNDYDLANHIALLAPTGRASKRIQESALVEAKTIHRFLKWNKESDTFQVNEYHKADVDFVIVDEFSMVDSILFSNLLKGLRFDTKIVLVGDYNQLPSVQAGCVLKDLIDSNMLNVVMLNKLYRQKDNSNIISLAYQINLNEIDKDIFKNKLDLEFINADSNNIMDKIINISKNYKDDLFNFQILAPMYKTRNGIDNINNIIKDYFNPQNNDKKEIIINDIVYRVNDKVIELTNIPDDNVYNGDIGVIVDINNGSKKEVTIDFLGNYVTFTQANFNKFKHAYAISIHKSQGSEFDYVLIPILQEYNKMLYKKLIYTAVTRCKKKLIIVGDYDSFIYSINNIDVDSRKTSLKERIINNINV